jgi:hypothetical protein
MTCSDWVYDFRHFCPESRVSLISIAPIADDSGYPILTAYRLGGYRWR